jgi:hypothetical protein
LHALLERVGFARDVGKLIRPSCVGDGFGLVDQPAHALVCVDQERRFLRGLAVVTRGRELEQRRNCVFCLHAQRGEALHVLGVPSHA